MFMGYMVDMISMVCHCQYTACSKYNNNGLSNQANIAILFKTFFLSVQSWTKIVAPHYGL